LDYKKHRILADLKPIFSIFVGLFLGRQNKPVKPVFLRFSKGINDE